MVSGDESPSGFLVAGRDDSQVFDDVEQSFDEITLAP